MSNRTHKILMAVAVVVMNAGFIIWTGANDVIENRHSTRKDFTAKSDTEVFELHVGRRNTSVTLKFAAELTEGRLRVEVFDPKGVSRGEFELSNSHVGTPARGRFEPELKYAYGLWKMRIVRHDATGGYDFDWIAQ